MAAANPANGDCDFRPLERRSLTPGVYEVRIIGLIDGSAGIRLSKAIGELAGFGIMRIVVNLERASGISSPGVGSLLEMRDVLRKWGGGLALAGAPRPVREALQLLGLTKTLLMADTPEAAASLV